LTTAIDFSAFEYRQRPESLSPRITSAYLQVLEWLEAMPQTAGFKDRGQQRNSRPDLDDDSWFGVARQFYWYFQTHFTKARNVLLRMSDEAIRKTQTSWLDEARLAVLDIGCGSGAATFALLDLACGYNQFCWDSKLATWPREIYLAAVEPSSISRTILEKFAEALRPELEFNRISLTISPITEYFPHPSCIQQLEARWIPEHTTTLLALSSNTIRPLQRMWNLVVGLALQAGVNFNAELGTAVAKAYDDVLSHYRFEQASFIHIATRGTGGLEMTLFQALYHVFEIVRRWFGEKADYSWWTLDEQLSVAFVNAKGTRFGDAHPGSIHETPYAIMINSGLRRSVSADLSYAKILDLANLELAWIRARHHALHDDFADDVELSLLDATWSSWLARFQRQLSSADWSALAVDQRIAFPIPKNERDDRPRTLLHMNEQVASAALSQTHPTAFAPRDPDHILGNRLNAETFEQFYEPWFPHWRSYWSAIATALEDQSVVCKLDVKSYYTEIPQHRIYRSLLHAMHIEDTSRTRLLLHALVMASLSLPHKPEHGIPQIGVQSALWATLFLQPVDAAMASDKPAEVQYFRYADDITIVAPQAQLAAQIKKAEDNLGLLELCLNLNKKKEYPAVYYQAHALSLSLHDNLAKAFRQLLLALYYLPSGYRIALRDSRDQFLSEYAAALSQIEVFAPAPFLNRKIRIRLSSTQRIRHRRYGFRVRFPRYRTGIDQTSWKQDFLALNPAWGALRDFLIKQLADLFRSAASQLLNERLDEFQVASERRNLRFAAYRLAVLGVSPILPELVAILRDKPWLLAPRAVLKALVDAGQVATVFDLAKGWHAGELPTVVPRPADGMQTLECNTYLCAAACKALGYGGQQMEIADFLWDVVQNEASKIYERMAASEALLRVGVSLNDRCGDLLTLSENFNTEPYFVKNLVLLLASANCPDVAQKITDIARRSGSMIVWDAVQYALGGSGNILGQAEPKVVERYYARKYPDVPIEFVLDDYPSLLV
jgi:SAM-dependent methyltransferase